MPASCQCRILPTDSAFRDQRFIEMGRVQSRRSCSRRKAIQTTPASESRRPKNGGNKRRQNLGMDMPKKRLVAEALIDLHRRLSALPSRSHDRRMIMRETAALYGVSEQTLYRALAERARPRALRRSDRGTPRAASPRIRPPSRSSKPKAIWPVETPGALAEALRRALDNAPAVLDVLTSQSVVFPMRRKD
jgi:hypothetical protein